MKQIIPHLWDIDEIGDMVHAYLWEWDGKNTLIDCGMPNSADKLLSGLVANGYPVHTIDRIIITHVDADHTGGLPAVKKATGAEVVCHVVEKQYMEHPAQRKTPSPVAGVLMRVLCMLPGFHQQPTTPDILVVDNDELPEGFTVIHTPGHTPGHIALLHREARLLIVGDALMNRSNKLTGPTPSFTPDKDAANRSILKLAKQYGDDYETIVFGHGPAILSNGGKRVRALASQLQPDLI